MPQASDADHASGSEDHAGQKQGGQVPGGTDPGKPGTGSAS